MDNHVEELIEFKERCKSNTKRINELEEEVKENRELTIAVKEIATEMRHLREDQANMNDRLKVIEEKPLKDYEETKKEIRKNIISFVSGVILTAITIGLGFKYLL